MAFKGDIIELRLMSPQGIALGMRLKSLAGWNQLASDWELLLNVGDKGNFVALYHGKEAGTVITLPYQHRFSWIGMVLVDPAFRGLGIGTTLLNKAIACAKGKGTIRLDATPQGKKLYETLGFQTERELVRMERPASKELLPPSQNCKIVSIDLLHQLVKADTAVFGANRGKVLNHLFHHAPQYAFYIEKKGIVTGYCLGRSGSNFEQIGPIIAENQHDARALLLTAMVSCYHKPVIVDVLTENTPWLDILESLEFKIQRPLIRMYLGELTHPGNPALQYAITGPELG